MFKKTDLDKQYTSINANYKKESGKVHFSSPSNIALVKYWGKKEIQIPQNSSLSFTLSNCKTETTVNYKKKTTPSNEFSFTFLFEGNPKPSFEPKIKTFLTRIYEQCTFLKDFDFIIDSKNTFPHSSGIASSASGMSALAKCFIEIEKELGSPLNEKEMIEKASFLARLGSGSACRSLEGPITIWGEHAEIANSSDLYAVPFTGEVHEVFNNYQDTVLLVDKGEKQVSSTVGHNLMHNHPFAEKRFEQANDNLTLLKACLLNGDLNKFIEIVESEALTLHAMMMTSLPYFVLMKPKTLEIINLIWEYREQTKTPLCFTLDAGANVHLLYPNQYKEEVLMFVKEKLAEKCQNGQFICDQTGLGAKKM